MRVSNRDPATAAAGSYNKKAKPASGLANSHSGLSRRLHYGIKTVSITWMIPFD